MNNRYVLPLSDPQATLEVVGGKGMSLARLARAGLPVPDGFHVTTEGYRYFVQVNDLQSQIMAILDMVDSGLPAELERASAAIGECFARAGIPAELQEAILSGYAALSGPGESTTGRPVAVRSSATAEDLPGASFAGQQEPYLNIRGQAALLQAVKDCWASLWTARAIAYRARQAIAPETVALAVVVQELVMADAAGVMFTANPIQGQRDQVVINAAWGLGEAIVSGAVTPDTIIVSRAAGKVIERQVAEKTAMTVLTESGVREAQAPARLRRKAVLSDAQALQLAHYGQQIEMLYEIPMDIEWTLARGQFAIVQARPVTSLPEAPLEWISPYPKSLLARGSFAEFLPNPVSPLFATLALPLARQASIALMNGYMNIRGGDSYLLTVINGYVYVGMPLTPKFLWQFIWASLTKSKKMLSESKERWQAARQHYLQASQAWQAVEPGSRPAGELVDGLRQIFAATAEYYTVVQSSVIPAAQSSEISFGRYYNALVRRDGDPEPEAFLLGLENKPLQAEKALFDLALWCKEQPELAGYLQQTPAEQVCTALQALQAVPAAAPLPEAIAGPAADEFALRFTAYLRDYGHAIYDLDFARPTSADDPIPLIEAIKAYLSGGGSNPYERQRVVTARSQQAEQAIVQRLGGLRRKWFLKLLRWAQGSAPYRENGIADMGLGYPQLHRLAGELGRRGVAGGAIENEADIYWLEAQELDSLAQQLDQGQAPADLRAVVEERKAGWHKARQTLAPMTIPEKSWMSKLMVHDNAAGSNTIKGLGASAGQGTAPACVMLGPEDFSKMKPGDVIVTVIPTPAWTPLFALASAVVTDIGGPLSHSSIVAREYGIPAVLATGSATRRIPDGQMITVDGREGVVTL